MKKTTLTVCIFISGLGVFAQDMGTTNPPQPTSTPADAAPAPSVAPAPVATTTTVYSTPPTRTYSAQTYGTPPSTASAADPVKGHVGVGVILGEPIGADVKYWVSDEMAVDGAFGWSDHRHSSIYFQGDVLWHKFDLINISPAPGRLPFYFGVGGLFRARTHGESNDVGIRVPVGVSYIFDNMPIDIFAEVGPALDVAPDLHGELTGGIGVRFWF